MPLLVHWLFIAFPIALVLLLAYCTKSLRLWLVSSVWMLICGVLAATGFFLDFQTVPPRMVFVIVSMILLGVLVARSRLGLILTNLPLGLLIGFQSFRFPLEVMIHWAAEAQIAPLQMTWNGWNFDVVTGITALCLAPWVSRVPCWFLWLWNIIGTMLLINVVAVAALSIPGPLQLIHPDNTWICRFPYIWLPTVCVLVALALHIATFRKLLERHENP